MNEKVINGDCLSVLKGVEDQSVDLVYLDPPFLTQKVQKLKTRDRKREFKFSDIWSSNEEYAHFLYSRLIEMHRVLTKSGSIFFHCDRKASHIARLLLDEVFGESNFRSEIIWHYRRWSNSQKALLPAHQNIYFYSKTDKYKFNTILYGYSPATNVDQILQKRVRDEHGKAIYERDEDGDIITNDPKKGVPLSDVWDIPYLNPKAKERVGYPTQKPVLLLKQIIELATDSGDFVLDPFCGSGTTLIAAKILGRRALGIDVSEKAVELTKTRLSTPVVTKSTLLEVGRDSYDNADQFALSFIHGLKYLPVHRNKGIDAILSENYEGRPVPIRIQRQNETVLEAASLLANTGRKKNAKLMILVVNDDDKGFLEKNRLPDGVVKVFTTPSQIRKLLGMKTVAATNYL